MVPTFLPPVAPSPGGIRKPELRLVESKFGDGYTQSRPDGLNHRREVVTLRWDGLTGAEMNAIVGFLRDRGGHEEFHFQPHGYDAPIRWTCRDWEAEHGPPWRLVATFRQSFAIAK